MLIADKSGGVRPLSPRGLLQSAPRANSPERPRVHTNPTPTDRVELNRKSGGDGATSDEEVQSSGDRFVAQYLFFLKSLADQARASGKNPSVDPQQLEEDLAELQNNVGASSPQDSAAPTLEELVAQENIASYSLSASVDYSESQITSFVSDGSGAAFAAAFNAHLEASFEGEIVMKDGSRLSVSASLQIDLSVSIAAAATTAQQAQPQRSDPLALDIDGDGDLSLSDASGGTDFDINADGQLDRTAFVTGNDVFLALDKNGNQKIDDGSELFGDQGGAANGFLALAAYDDDKNGQIDATDSVFNSLRGVRMGADGTLQTSTLAELGVQSIALQYANIAQLTREQNLLTQLGSYQTTAGDRRSAYDANVVYRPLSTSA